MAIYPPASAAASGLLVEPTGLAVSFSHAPSSARDARAKLRVSVLLLSPTLGFG